MSNLLGSRPFIAPTVVVPPADTRSVALVPQKPIVAAKQAGVLIKLSELADHDRGLAATLRERLDFRNVLEGGSRLSASDAHGVLDWRQYERFEVIRSGLLERDRLQAKAKLIFRGTVGAIGLAIGAAACFTRIPGEALILIGMFGGGLGMFFGSVAADEAEAASKQAVARIPTQLLALPAPAVTAESAAKDRSDAA